MGYEIPAHYKVIATEVFTVGDTPAHPKGYTLRTGDPRAEDHPTAALFTVNTNSVKVSLAYPRPEHYEAKAAVLGAVYADAFTSGTPTHSELQINTDQQRLELRHWIAASPTQEQYAVDEALVRAFIAGTKSIVLGKVNTTPSPDVLETSGQYKGYFHLDGDGGDTAFTMERTATGLQIFFIGGIRGDVSIANGDTVWLVAYTTNEVQVYDSAFDGHVLAAADSDRRTLFVEGREKLLRTGFVREDTADADVAVTYFA